MKFSVSICVYEKDNPEHFSKALDSLFLQTRKPDEIVLAVDGPIGEELENVIKKYDTYTCFKVVRQPENKGHGIARRLSIENCTYPLIAIMDSDDVALLDRFEKQINIFKSSSEVDVCGGQIEEFIENEDNIIGKRVVPESDREIKKYLKSRCPFNQQTVMFKKDIYTKAGGYVDWYMDEDYYLWARMYLAGAKFCNLPDTLVKARINADSYKRRGGVKYFRSEKRLQKFLRKNGIISYFKYFTNVLKRFVVQVLMPSKVRSFVFIKFAREKVK